MGNSKHVICRAGQHYRTNTACIQLAVRFNSINCPQISHITLEFWMFHATCAYVPTTASSSCNGKKEANETINQRLRA
jgi:hypothetical protein